MNLNIQVKNVNNLIIHVMKSKRLYVCVKIRLQYVSAHTLVVKVWRVFKNLKTKFVAHSRHYAVITLILSEKLQIKWYFVYNKNKNINEQCQNNARKSRSL